MFQPDLFGGPAQRVPAKTLKRPIVREPRRARRLDPVTSHAAADAAESFASRHGALIVAALQRHGRMSKTEIAAVTGLDGVAVARRLPELDQRGLARVVEGETRPSAAGRAERVWEAVEATGNVAGVQQEARRADQA